MYKKVYGIGYNINRAGIFGIGKDSNVIKRAKNGFDDIYVVGCGPSLRKFDWSLLSNKTTISVNGAFQDVPNSDYFITGDSGFAIKAAKELYRRDNTCRVLVMSEDHKRYRFVKPYTEFYDWVISPKACDGEIGFTEDDFHTGQNSGFCGMQLAVLLGAKRIHLLGIDLNTEGGLHYHVYYPNLDVSRLDEFTSHFQLALAILDQHNDIEVISHSPISRLNSFIRYEELR